MPVLDKEKRAWRMRQCRKCGGKIEDPNSLVPDCFACRLAANVPSWYEGAEGYHTCRVHHIPRARHTPRTGVDLLDTPSGVRIADMAMLLTAAQMDSLRAFEAATGQAHDPAKI